MSIGATGFLQLNGAASDSSSVVYTTSQATTAGVNGMLLAADATAGTGTAGTSLVDATITGARGLAFSATNTLYAGYDTAASQSVGIDDLYTVNTNTGHWA